MIEKLLWCQIILLWRQLRHCHPVCSDCPICIISLIIYYWHVLCTDILVAYVISFVERLVNFIDFVKGLADSIEFVEELVSGIGFFEGLVSGIDFVDG